MTAAARRVPIARVGRPHGVRGEVRVVPFNPQSEVLAVGLAVELALPSGARRPARLSALRPGPGAWLARFEGVDDRDAVAALSGATVEVPRAALPPLEPGEYYLSDLVGAAVHGPDGLLGEVVEVRVHPSVDAAVIRRVDGTLVEQPLVPPWVEAVEVGAVAGGGERAPSAAEVPGGGQGARLVLASLDGLIE